MVRLISKNRAALGLQGLACALAAGACSANQATEAESTPAYVENLPSDLRPVEIEQESVDDPREPSEPHLGKSKPQEEIDSGHDAPENEATNPERDEPDAPGDEQAMDPSPQGALPETPATTDGANDPDGASNADGASMPSDADKPADTREPNDASKSNQAPTGDPKKQPPAPAEAPPPSR